MRIHREEKMSLSVLFGCDRLQADGFGWEFLNSADTQDIAAACDEIFASSERKFGIRDVNRKSDRLAHLIDRKLLPIAKKYLHSDAFLVRSTLFDKPESSNWAVPWHQDVTIEVEERCEVDGFGPWSIKDEIVSVQPPSPILEKMLTLRLHFDPTNEDNGALLVEPSSHLNGKLRITEIVAENPIVCSCQAGEILMMKPLLFHASNRSISANPRRVLHLDFAYEALPNPLSWRH